VPVVEHVVEVAAPPARCFEVFADLAAWPQWFPYLARASGELRPGGQLHLTFSAGQRPFPLSLAVEDVQPEAFVRWSGGAYGLRGRHTHSFASDGNGGTRVSWREEISGLGARLLTRNLLEKIREEVAGALHRWKALVEAQAT
jgi:uncharacterized protein YndB with AHSA1/START domain